MSTKQKKIEHAADEAGGEVVFSSDGLGPPPVQLRPPPIRSSSATTATTGGDDVVDSGIIFIRIVVVVVTVFVCTLDPSDVPICFFVVLLLGM